DGQLGGPLQVPLGGSAPLAEVALPPPPHAVEELGPFPAPAPALAAGGGGHRGFGLPGRRGPGIGSNGSAAASPARAVGSRGSVTTQGDPVRRAQRWGQGKPPLWQKEVTDHLSCSSTTNKP